MTKLFRLSAVLIFVLGSTISCAKSAMHAPQDSLGPAIQAQEELKQGAILVDVRSEAEYASGHIEGALNIPYDQVAARISEFGNDKSRSVVLYCQSGRRAGLAKEALEQAGFTNVLNAGGYGDMLEAMGPH